MTETKIYGILMDIFEDDIYIGTEPVNRLFKSENEAWNKAYWIADSECISLNDECSNCLVSYGVVDQECQGFVSVNKYILESEDDDTGETEMLIKYRVVEFIIME